MASQASALRRSIIAPALRYTARRQASQAVGILIGTIQTAQLFGVTRDNMNKKAGKGGEDRLFLLLVKLQAKLAVKFSFRESEVCARRK